MTNEDKKLLELAAKAAGYNYKPTQGVIVVDGVRCNWSPLDDDGDAFDLVVRLRLSVDHNHPADQQPWVSADRGGCEGCYIEDVFDESQRADATRRAIVRAAAAIGEAMR